jgi:hypothetical protein
MLSCVELLVSAILVMNEKVYLALDFSMRRVFLCRLLLQYPI